MVKIVSLTGPRMSCLHAGFMQSDPVPEMIEAEGRGGPSQSQQSNSFQTSPFVYPPPTMNSMQVLKILFYVIFALTLTSILYRLLFGHTPVLYTYDKHVTIYSLTPEISEEPSNGSSTTSSPTKGSSPTTVVSNVLVPSKYQPYKNIPYNRAGGNTDRSVFVVPRRVYFDTRIHKGQPRNILTILAEVHDDAVKTVEACELNGFFSDSVSVIKENTGWVRARKPGYTHCAIIVECKGMNLKAITNGSFPKLVYKKSGEEEFSLVVSEVPLILKNYKSTPLHGKGSAVACTTMYGHPANFDHWLRYQKTLGVDGIHLNADQTFFDNSTVVYPFLNESLHNGFVKVEVWTDVVDKRIYYLGQVTKYQDCIFRHIDTYDYVLIYDYDDYFNPLIPTEKNIHYYLNKFFEKSSTGTVRMPWRQMACRPTEEKCKTLQDGNLTSVLSGYGFSKRSEAKCAHRVNALMFIMVHSHQSLLSGYSNIKSSDKLAYVAHNRYNNKLCT